MKQTKRWLAVLLACAVLLANIPALFVLAESTDALNLTTLDDFTGSTTAYSVSSGAVLSVSDSTAVGGGKMLKVDPGTTGSWSKVKLTVPLNDTAVGTAQGLLIYTEWTDHNNFYVKVNAAQDGQTVSAGPAQWNQPPVFDAQNDVWTVAGESDNADMLKAGSGFKGYLYLPFAILSTTLTSSATLTSIEIEGFNTGTNTGYAVGSIYLVNNAVLPTRATGSETLSTDVLLDGEQTSLVKTAAYEGIELTTLDDFTGQGTYPITQNGNTLEGATATVIGNVGTIGSGGTLAVDLNNDNSWGIGYVKIPLSLDTGSAKGLLVYAEWGKNGNLFIRLSGADASGTATVATPNLGWSNYPLYDAVANAWEGSIEIGTNPSYGVEANFKGYLYIPFDRLTASLASVNSLELGAFRADDCATFRVGGVWLVTNDRIPSAYAEGIATKVRLDGVETSLLMERASFAGATVTLGDDLDLNFHARIPDSIKSDDMKATFTLDGTALPDDAIGEVNADGYYEFTAEVPAKDMTAPIKATITDSTGRIYVEKTYTVKEYGETILISDTYSDTDKNVAKAMLNYGAMAQTYWNTRVTALANASCAYSQAELDAADVSQVASMTVANQLASFMGTTLLLKSKTAVRLYFSEEVTTGMTAKANGDDTVYYVAVTGLGADDLSKTQTVTVGNAQYTFSVLSVAKSVIGNADYDVKFQNLMKALVLYAQSVDIKLEEDETEVIE